MPAPVIWGEPQANYFWYSPLEDLRGERINPDSVERTISKLAPEKPFDTVRERAASQMKSKLESMIADHIRSPDTLRFIDSKADAQPFRSRYVSSDMIITLQAERDEISLVVERPMPVDYLATESLVDSYSPKDVELVAESLFGEIRDFVWGEPADGPPSGSFVLEKNAVRFQWKNNPGRLEFTSIAPFSAK